MYQLQFLMVGVLILQIFAHDSMAQKRRARADAFGVERRIGQEQFGTRSVTANERSKALDAFRGHLSKQHAEDFSELALSPVYRWRMIEWVVLKYEHVKFDHQRDRARERTKFASYVLNGGEQIDTKARLGLPTLITGQVEERSVPSALIGLIHCMAKRERERQEANERKQREQREIETAKGKWKRNRLAGSDGQQSSSVRSGENAKLPNRGGKDVEFYRTWTVDGRKQKGILVAVKSKTVLLFLKDRQEVRSIPISKLSTADEFYVNHRIAEADGN